jgi:hypothetical protein
MSALTLMKYLELTYNNVFMVFARHGRRCPAGLVRPNVQLS